ncbi:unnamed protein product [Spirodela intermedia]|uniref:Uncharacterized protein n=1 Tax=Spirodela intermedia TaxID=51605 RepID=A0A7I8JIE8_SPIIN|nr:unnamed protein product [Spirodela intermedia]CAA6669515.1 unnamed protein product [Spirodela intermedia]
MASCVISSVPILLLHFILFFSNRLVAGSRLTTYIIHVDAPPPHLRADPEGREAWHRSFLPVHLMDSGEQRLLYSYEHAITGFAARLTEEELAVVREMDGFLAAYPDELIPLQTTHSPEYLKLQASRVWNNSNYGEGVIIGVLDSGINPDHPSFVCDLPPPPSTWKGQCDFGPDRCNRLIGARGFTLGLRAMHAEGLAGEISLGKAPFDPTGHGTHVASTAAGCFVDAAAASAYLSVYKVCDSVGCTKSDILVGFDAAISDRVHVASLSIGTSSSDFYSDMVAVGGFRAMEEGIFVIYAAGNYGPSPHTLSNDSPWQLTVGATTMDRSIRATVGLGNGLEFYSESLHQPGYFGPTQRPLVLGGSSMILADTVREGNTTLAEAHVLPVSRVSSYVGLAIKQYITSGSNATATIVFNGTVTEEQLTRRGGVLLSRGPSIRSPGILKPDIVAPGSSFFVISGTSMATPHVSGMAALIKSPHPTWSPAAIKSMLMTSANQVDARGAIDTSVVYEITSSDYIAICTRGDPDADQLGPLETSRTTLNPEFVGVSATVLPATLTFSSGEKKQYTVTFAKSGRDGVHCQRPAGLALQWKQSCVMQRWCPTKFASAARGQGPSAARMLSSVLFCFRNKMPPLWSRRLLWRV